MKVTKVQAAVLKKAKQGKITHPRRSLELLEKKGLVEGNKRNGWTITYKGCAWLNNRTK